jgi:hypothetical protein
MKALLSSATFGLLAVPSTTTDPACDNGHDRRPTTSLKDEHYERQDLRPNASSALPRSASLRCVALILIVAVLLIVGSVASTCAYHRPANTIAVHLND